MIITLSGKAGSGKWTVAKLLSEKLWYQHISIGDMKRDVATSMGLTISEFNILWEQPENKATFDLKYEDYQKSLALDSGIILDSRLGFYCQPQAFKVYLDVSDEEAARRIFGDKERSGDTYASLQAVQEATQQRNADDIQRFKELYHVDMSDMTNFNLVVDTDNKTPQQVCEEIIAAFHAFGA